ncbi:MAG: hypothetical protein AAF993_15655 [Pseudomonadota bacterium]
MSRFSAFAIHLGLSLVIFVGLAYLVVFQWYPDFFFTTDGGWRGMRIIVFVDLVLGPTLTLVVYKHGKPGLRTDLSIIGVVQIACLIAGTYVVYAERPLAMVYNDGRFSVLSADDYTDAGIDVPDLSEYAGTGPKWVMIEIPTELYEEADFRARYFKTGRALNTFAELYQPFDFEHPQVRNDPLEPATIRSQEQRAQALDTWLAQSDGTEEDYLFYSIASRFTYGVLAFDRASGEYISLVD